MTMGRSAVAISKARFEVLAVTFVLIVYASFGSPTPDNLTWAEALQALGLIILAFLGLSSMHKGRLSQSFSYFFWLSLITGLMSSFENELRQIIRDLIAHCFLGISIFWNRKLSTEQIQGLFNVMTFAGAVLSFRFLLETDFSFSALVTTQRFSFDGFLKLNTDPLVTFAAAYGAIAFFDRQRSPIVRFALLSFSMAAILAIGLSALRGPMAIFCIVALIATLQSGINRNFGAAVAFLALILITLQNIDLIYIFLDNFQNKMGIAGTFPKWEEFSYVMSTAGGDFFSILFGSGFGSYIDVGNRSLPFTHSFISYYFAKTGVFACIFAVVFLLGLSLRFIISRNSTRPEIVLLLLITLYGLVINPHYKYMTFGFIIALLLQETRHSRLRRFFANEKKHSLELFNST